jgi:hypothetical protein
VTDVQTTAAGGSASGQGGVYCDSGDAVVSGGYAAQGLASSWDTARVFYNLPITNSDPQGWLVVVNNINGTSGVTYTIYARCLDIIDP